jgi:signal peptidase I
VIAIPGDKVQIINKKVYINGLESPDPHAHFSDPNIYPESKTPRDNHEPFEVPKGALFVMGDNRDNSADGRFWGFVPVEDVKGEAFIIYYSPRNIGGIRWDRFFKLIH